MRSAEEIKKLRSGRGFFTRQSVLDALEQEGISMTRVTYTSKEHGKTPFTAREIKALIKIYGITAEEGLEFFA